MRVHSRVMCARVSIHLHVCVLCTECATCVHVSVVCTQATYICIYVRARCSGAGLMWNVCACDACTGMCICAHACVCMRRVCIAHVVLVCMNACVCACAHVACVCLCTCVLYLVRALCVACPPVQWTTARSLMVTWTQAGGSLCPSDTRGHPALSLEPPRPPISPLWVAELPPHVSCTSQGPRPALSHPFSPLSITLLEEPALHCPQSWELLSGVLVPCSVRKARLRGLSRTRPASWVALDKLLHLFEPPFPPA